jgi:hypothetical protein
MKLLISGAGVAGALMIAGGTPVVGLSQAATSTGSGPATAAVHSAAGDDVASSVDETKASTTDVEATEPDETQSEDTSSGESMTEDETTENESSVGQTLGQAHAAAMKVWTQCVADAASGPKTDSQPIPPKLACGPKPLGPGQILQQQGLTTDTEATTDTEEKADTDEVADADDIDAEHGAAPNGRSNHAAPHGNGHKSGASHKHHGR